MPWKDESSYPRKRELRRERIESTFFKIRLVSCASKCGFSLYKKPGERQSRAAIARAASKTGRNQFQPRCDLGCHTTVSFATGPEEKPCVANGFAREKICEAVTSAVQSNAYTYKWVLGNRPKKRLVSV